MRIDVLAGGKRVWSEGLDAAGGWAWPGGDPAAEPESAGGVKPPLKHGVEFNLYGLHRYAERGHHLTLDGRETLDGTDYHVCRIDLADGFRDLSLYRRQDLDDRTRPGRAGHPPGHRRHAELLRERLRGLSPRPRADHDLHSARVRSMC